jgi:hypothetical protein
MLTAQIGEACDSALLRNLDVRCIRQLLKVAAAADIDTARVAQLLQAAAMHCSAACIQQLCNLP